MRRRDEGATAVEFALLVPLVLLLLSSLVLFGLRAVHAGLAENAARTALREVVLPVSSGSRAVDPEQVCQRARQALPAMLRPADVTCIPSTPSSTSSSTSSSTAPVRLVVQVCPPACDGELALVACPTASTGPTPAGPRPVVPLLGQAAAAPRQVAVALQTPASPSPSPSPAQQGSFGGLLPQPTETPTLPAAPTELPALPLPTAQATAEATTGVDVGLPDPELPGVEVSVPGLPPVVVDPDPTLPSVGDLFPSASSAPRPPACGDELEGRRAAVRITWSARALEPLQGLTLGAFSEGITSVTAVASGRRE